MRAKEFLYEDYQQKFQSAVQDLLIASKANGASNLSTPALVNALQNAGWPATIANVEQLLQQDPTIMNSTPDEVTLTPNNGAEQGTQDQDSASRVSDMAAKATAKSK